MTVFLFHPKYSRIFRIIVRTLLLHSHTWYLAYACLENYKILDLLLVCQYTQVACELYTIHTSGTSPIYRLDCLRASELVLTVQALFSGS